jgi:bifunctional non-homologous end joining protein LigD
MARLTSPDKVLFGPDGVTKQDLAHHYERVAPYMLPHIRGRPVTLQVFPGGIGRPGHFAKQIPEYFPDSVPRVTVPKKGGTVTHPLAEKPDDLLWMAQHNTITPHVWTSRVPDLDRPDRLVVDLDPSLADDFTAVRRAARMVGDLFRDVGLEPFAMVTGSRGVHVVAPLVPDAAFDEVFALAKRLAAEAVEASPGELTTEFLKENRDDRIFVDVLRNRWAQTVPAPYAVRPRPGAPVVVPLRWEELSSSRLAPDRWTLRTIGRRLARVGDPWAGMDEAAASVHDIAARLS